MPRMTTVDSRAVMRRYIDAAREGDWDTASGFFAEDIVLRIPGRSSLAGERRGREAALAYIEAALARAHEGEVEVELVDMLASEERVALIVRERFRRPEGDVEILRSNVYRIAGGQISEIWIFEGDQYAVDELFAD
jgi:ketosteroid isomerase-like protein